MNWNFSEIKKLLSKSDIKKFNGEIRHLNLDVIQGNEIKDDDIDLNNLLKNSKGSLMFNGRECLVYIKNDRSGKQKWHFHNCSTLRNHSNYDQRFVATRREDGLFLLSKGKETSLEVCQNCITQSKSNWLVKKARQDFDLSFGEEFNRWLIPRVLKNILKGESYFIKESHLENHEVNGYVWNWPMISYKFRMKNNWTCQDCKVNLKYSRGLLHTHHFDRNKKNNDESNFRCLCVECHSKQDGHNHMVNKFKKEIEQVRLKRRIGGLL